jgi:hypothetical protein
MLFHNKNTQTYACEKQDRFFAVTASYAISSVPAGNLLTACSVSGMLDNARF